jgi:monoamine oxidase
MHTFKNPLLNQLRKDLAIKRNRLNYSDSRRAFIRNASIYTVGAVAGMQLLSSCNGNSKSKADIAIVGGGLAGLNALKMLHQNGINADLYEASNRFGGRVFTEKMDDALLELGGEFINSDHEHLLDLLKELNIETIDVFDTEYDEALYFFEGKEILYEEILAEIEMSAGAKFVADMAALPEFVESGNVHLWRMYDAISIETYLNAIKIKPWLKSILVNAYEAEFGLPASKQSAMNLLSLLDPEMMYFDPLGEFDKRYIIKGGTETLVQKILEKCPDSKFLNHQLKAVNFDEKEAKYELEILNTLKGDVQKKKYSFILLTLPYSVLRSIPLRIPLSEVRKDAIAELAYGNSVKAAFLFQDKVWQNLQFNGEVFTDSDIQKIRNISKQSSLLLTAIAGGNKGVEFSEKLSQNKIDDVVRQLDACMPGAELAFANQCKYKDWSKDVNYGASASCYAVGQWTKFYGSESEDEGNLFFAGEHVSRVYQSTMNGAIESSITAVSKLLKKLI